MIKFSPLYSLTSVRRIRGGIMSLLCVLWLTAIAAGRDEPPRPVLPDDPMISYSDYVHMELVRSTANDTTTFRFARFDRILDMPSKGYRWDNPGARVRFRTDATAISVSLYFNELHTSTSARNDHGLYLIDGVNKPGEWTFRTEVKTTQRPPGLIQVQIKPGGPAAFHDYDIVLPYGDSVDFHGLMVDGNARFEPVRPRPATRYLAYGDSITHGFTASAVDKTYSYLVAEKNGWQILNLGLGGRASNKSDAAVVASLKADVISVFMGANDWQSGVPVETYRANMMAFLDGIRAEQPTVPIYYLTSLWVAPSWNPKAQVADLESYRQVVRDIVTARQDANLHLVEGPELIDHEVALFDAAPVHPNDKGFAQMAERLAAKMRPAGK